MEHVVETVPFLDEVSDEKVSVVKDLSQELPYSREVPLLFGRLRRGGSVRKIWLTWNHFLV